MKRIFRAFAVLLSLLVILVALFWRRDLSLEELKAKYADADSQFMDLDGMPVHFRDEGNLRDSLPLVLLHGTGASLHTWQGWVDEFRTDRRIIRFDLPGYGLTGPNPDRDYSMDYYAGFVLDFLDRRGIGRFVLGGNSLGGRIALAVALRAPGRLAGLILVDAAGYPVDAQSRPLAFRMAQWPVVRQLFRYVTPRAVIARSIRNVYADAGKVDEALIDRYDDLARRSGNRQAFLDRMQKQTGPASAYHEYSSIEIPTLILWGEEDRLIPVEAAQRFHADLTNDTLVILSGLGHVPMEEDPIQTAVVVRRFLETEKLKN